MIPGQEYQQEEEDDLSYIHKQMMSLGGGSQNQWQVDPRDIRIHVEETLKGQRTRIVKRRMYHVVTVQETQFYSGFFANNDDQAEKLFHDLIEKDRMDSKLYTIMRTSQEEETEVTDPISDPLVNDTGAYHLLSIIETIFSRIGYMSNIDDNEINNIMYQDVVVPLATTMMRNHVLYGIKKGSRDEIMSLIVNTSFLILKGSRKGWTGDRFAGIVKETIVNTNETPTKRRWGGILG